MPQYLQKKPPIGLVQAGAIDRVVFGHHNPDDRSNDATPSKSNSGTDPVCSRKVDDMAGRQGDCGPSAGTQPQTDESIPQTVMVFHEFHAAHVLFLNAHFTGCILESDGRVRDALEDAGVSLSGRFDDLNLLARREFTKIRPGSLIRLCHRSARNSKETDQEQRVSHKLTSMQANRCTIVNGAQNGAGPDWHSLPAKKSTTEELSTVNDRNVVLLLEGWANILRLHQRRKIHRFGCQIFVRNLRQEMADDIEPRGFLVFRVDDEPRGLLVVSVVEHVVLGAGVISPMLAGFEVHGADLPALGGIGHAVLKTALLLRIAHRKPVLDEDDS